MSRRADAAILLAASALFLGLVAGAARQLGANYEEVVAYVLQPLDIRDVNGPAAPPGVAPRFVVSTQLPRLSFQPSAGVSLPLLNQPYMTDHLSYGGVLLRALGVSPLWAARGWHALFGLVLLFLLYDVARSLGLGRRATALAVLLAATSLPLTFMYSWARFDESLASFGAVAVLAAALRHARDGARRWLWAGVFAAVLAVSAKLTATWPLAGLLLAAFLAGWRPPRPGALWRPMLAAAPLLAPLLGFALAGPATGNEVQRRLSFLSDLFTSDAIPGAALNLVDYLGSWGSILSAAMRGAEGHAGNIVGWVLVSATLIWLLWRACAAGAAPRRQRLETQMLAFLAVIFVLVALFFREHRDYQFSLLVPLHALALGMFLDWCAARWLDRRLPALAAGAVVCALPLAANLRDQVLFREDLLSARNAMFDLDAQRASADWMVAHGVRRPIVPTFYATGIYELLSGGTVRPVYPFPLFRHAKDFSFIPDYPAVWRRLLADGEGGDRYALLPVGVNPIEAQHFDEPAIRAALRAIPGAARVATFSSARGEPLLEAWRIPAAWPAVAGAP